MVTPAKPKESDPIVHYPYPVMGTVGLDLGSRHKCMELIRVYREQGFINDCVHADAAVVDTNPHDRTPSFGVRCARHSFDVRPMAEGSFGPKIASNARGFYGCPHPCHYQRGRWSDRARRFGGHLLDPLQWFDRQPWQVKVTVLLVPLLLLVVYRGPETIRAVTELAKTVWPK
jgi:hypothetical protein